METTISENELISRVDKGLKATEDQVVGGSTNPRRSRKEYRPLGIPEDSKRDKRGVVEDNSGRGMPKVPSRGHESRQWVEKPSRGKGKVPIKKFKPKISGKKAELISKANADETQRVRGELDALREIASSTDSTRGSDTETENLDFGSGFFLENCKGGFEFSITTLRLKKSWMSIPVASGLLSGLFVNRFLRLTPVATQLTKVAVVGTKFLTHMLGISLNVSVMKLVLPGLSLAVFGTTCALAYGMAKRTIAHLQEARVIDVVEEVEGEHFKCEMDEDPDENPEDFRADVMALGKLKHPRAYYGSFEYTRHEFHPIPFVWPRETKANFRVSYQLLSQFLSPQNVSLMANETQSADRLDHIARSLHSVNIDRFMELRHENIVQNTVLLAYGLVRKMKQNTKDVVFPRAPVVVGSEITCMGIDMEKLNFRKLDLASAVLASIYIARQMIISVHQFWLVWDVRLRAWLYPTVIPAIQIP